MSTLPMRVLLVVVFAGLFSRWRSQPAAASVLSFRSRR
jgi:hypothetical protein